MNDYKIRATNDQTIMRAVKPYIARSCRVGTITREQTSDFDVSTCATNARFRKTTSRTQQCRFTHYNNTVHAYLPHIIIVYTSIILVGQTIHRRRTF